MSASTSQGKEVDTDGQCGEIQANLFPKAPEASFPIQRARNSLGRGIVLMNRQFT